MVVFEHGGGICFLFGLCMRALSGIGCKKSVDFVVWLKMRECAMC